MPVHEIRYRAYEGQLTPGPLRLLSIPKYSLMSIFNKWIATSVFGVGVITMLILSAYLFLSNSAYLATFPMVSGLVENLPELKPRALFEHFYRVQYFICLIPLLLAAPKLISRELQHNGLPLLFSRPLSRTGYIIGKLATLAVFISFLTWVQAIVLFIVMIAFYPGDHEFIQNFFSDSLPMLVGVLFVGGMITTVLSLIGLMASAFSKNFRFCALILLVLIVGSEAFSGLLALMLKHDHLWFGVNTLFWQLAVLVFGTDETGIPVPTIIFGMTMWTLIPIAFLYWRLKPVEVFKE